MAGVSIWQLAIIALIFVLLFGTKKLRGFGADLGESIKGFKKAMGDSKADVLPELLDANFSSGKMNHEAATEEIVQENKNKL
ncbi:twin-arginine translocase TatA/TatE family subunit [Aeromonas veronii]|uniref:twin-arginine translocase TatA/TatE family subunit n=1 Tax=Aeromonas veronii TaxID=654 RepID=UPI00226CB73D|nr:twin-arginine translocase TatA/TatE family subunit [Aeromonas veronii]MCX9134856.1 twin-arginine translocase TatA/TatE family subunit [Aeromonas veronii]